MQISPDLQLHCPMCHYDLRELTEPRCPECGFAFTWEELVDAKRDRHPWLFEHAKRPWSKPLRAFALTVWHAGLRPWKFWRDVSPTNPVRTKRLLFYWAMLNLPLLLLVFLAAATQVGNDYYQFKSLRAGWHPVVGTPNRYYSTSWNGATSYTTEDELSSYAPHLFSRQYLSYSRYTVLEQITPILEMVVVAIVWPWLTAAAIFASFRWSLRRAKIDLRHTIRVAIYASNVSVLAIVLGTVVYGPAPVGEPVYSFAETVLPRRFSRYVPKLISAGYPDRDLVVDWWTELPMPKLFGGVPALILIAPLLALACTIRSSVAFRRYMRFDHAVLTAVAVQVIAAIGASVILIQLSTALPYQH